MQKYFASQQEDEEVIMVIRRHWIVLVVPFLTGVFIYFILFLLLIFLPNYLPQVVSGFSYDIYVPVMSLAFLFNTLYIFIEWLTYYLHVGIVTTEHLVDIGQKTLFSRQISTMDLENIQDVTASQKGIIQTLYNYGDVLIQTAGETPNFVLEKTPNPYDLGQKIMELKESYVKKNYADHFVNHNNGL